MVWQQFIVRGVWKTGTGCFAIPADGSSHDEVALSCHPVQLQRGMVVQGLFVKNKDRQFAGKPFYQMDRYVPRMNINDTARTLAPLGLSDAELKIIYNMFGSNTAYKLLSRPSNIDRFHADFGIDRTREVKSKLQSARELDALRTEFPFLSKATCDKITNRLGKNAAQTLKNDPYLWCKSDTRLLRFADAERIYMSVGGRPMDTRRIDSLLSQSAHALITKNGDMFMEVSNTHVFQTWMDTASEMSGKVDDSWMLPSSCLSNYAVGFTSRGEAVTENANGAVYMYLMNDLVDEKAVGELRHWTSMTPLYHASGKQTLQRISDYCEQTGYMSIDGTISMDSNQIMAIVSALRNRISVIAGGPGRGKTAITACICDCWRKEFGDNAPIMLTSLTGKAVSRLKASVGKMISMEGIITTTLANAIVNPKIAPQSIRKSLVIIDEASMVDMRSMARFLPKLNDVQIVFIGDVDQLPSIGAGQLLRDLIGSDVIPVTYLTKNYRAKGRDGATLANNSDAIAENRIPDIIYDEHFKWCNTSVDETTMFNDILDCYMDLLKTETPDDICLLSPFKSEKDAFSVMKLNHAIQARRNLTQPNTVSCPVMYHGTPICEGDRIVVTHNLPEYTLVNGDTGTLKAYQLDNSVLIELDDGSEVVMSMGDASENLELGYALTIHKSQGSEYRHVLVAISSRMSSPWAQNFATRNLVYTAVTRSSSCVHLFGSKTAFEQCLTNIMTPRKTLLMERLRGNI